MLFSTSGAVGLWLSIGVLCAKAVVAETIRRAETMAILSVLNIAISLDMGDLHDHQCRKLVPTAALAM